MAKRKKAVVSLLVFFCLAATVVIYFQQLRLNSMCSLPDVIPTVFPRLTPRDNTNVTVVTAFFDVGAFQKGDEGDDPSQQTPDTYLQWAETMLFLQNPMIVFTDSARMVNLFRYNCSKKNLKAVFVSDRSNLLAFQNLPRIAAVFADPEYPKFHPNTVLPEYSCSQHAKMDVMEQALGWDDFHTKYFAWVDIGYFRHLLFRRRNFWISVPPELDDQKIAACEIDAPNFVLDADEIFKTNRYWVGGGMMLGTRSTYSKFVAEYLKAMEHFLEAGLANTDQQVMYAMFKPSVKKSLNITTELQLFSWSGNLVFGKCWFYLGYYCYREQ